MALQIEDLVKVYRGGVRANDGVSLSVAEGEVFGLLGHNGAGKTTLVNQVIGLLKPTSGRITIDGVDAVAQPARARQLCSVQAQAQVPISGLTARQAIEMVGRLRGGDRQVVRRRAQELSDALQLGEWIDAGADPTKEVLSGGIRRLVSFAMTVVVPGRVVILDEPTNDVDPMRRRLLWEQVRALGEAGCAVLLITHNVVDAERAVDRLAVMDRGRVVAEGTPPALKAPVAGELRLEIVWEPGAAIPDLPDFVLRQVEAGHRWVGSLPRERVREAVSWAEHLQTQGLAEEFSVGAATLEDVYVHLLGRFPADDDEEKEDRDAALAV